VLHVLPVVLLLAALAGAADPAERSTAMLRAQVDGGVDVELRWSDFRDLREDLRRFYEARGWTPAWTRGERLTDQAWQVAALLAAAERKGLDPEDYGGDWAARLAVLDQDAGTEAERVRIDVALTASALRYASDLAVGRVRPLPGTELLGRLQLQRAAGPTADLVAAVGAADVALDPDAVFEALEPDWPAYRRTQAELARWQDGGLGPVGPPLLPPPTGAPVAPERYADAERLAARLRTLGDLVEPADATYGDADAACASPLADAVARFQARHGLDASGFVDAATVRELDAPRALRLAQLTLALERWRWFPRKPPASWIVVNVPEFALHAGNGAHLLSMRVVVGQAYEWGTPLLASPLSRVVFRPAWGVPYQIQQEELVPHVEANRGFLAAGDFEVVDVADQPVPPPSTAELLGGLRSGALRLRQRPGVGNALGLVKFVLDNSNWIYLHGTPSTDLFARSRRDFSHGCIRVEDPAALARWVLRDEPGWTPQAIRGAMAGARTVDVPLRVPVQVLIGYFTAAAWTPGEVAFFEDVYGQDAALRQALADEARRRGAP
jgi:murein L,D-transpeptidase YcbB/YkuD